MAYRYEKRMKELSKLLLEKLKINKSLENFIDIKDAYHEGDICMLIEHTWKGEKLSLSFIKIQTINWDKNNIWFGSIGVRDNIIKYNKVYSYKFKDTKKYEYIVLAKTYGVEYDTILIPQYKVKETFKQIIKDKFKFDFNKYLNLPSKEFLICKGIHPITYDIYKYNDDDIKSFEKIINEIH